jgi:hypothetical protein
MTYPKSKEQVTQLVLSEIPDSADNPWKDLALDTLLFRWWLTGRTGFGLRLSDEGAKAFELANITYYDFPLGLSKDKTKSPEAFVQELSKKIKCPYYIAVNKVEKKVPSIRIYDNKIAMMLTLYGTLREYLDSFNGV